MRLPTFVAPGAVALALVAAPLALSSLQRTSAPPLPPTPTPQQGPMTAVRMDSAVFAGLRWRDVGPARGGRSVAAIGSVARPNEYWMGTTGGFCNIKHLACLDSKISQTFDHG
jgi:hypothetical protein